MTTREYPGVELLPEIYDSEHVQQVLERLARRLGGRLIELEGGGVKAIINASVIPIANGIPQADANALIALGWLADMIGASASDDGERGLVPQPLAGDDTKVLFGDGTWQTPPGAGGGEANTASNLGGGTGVFSAKVAVDLQLRSLVGGANISISSTASEITIAVTALDTDDITNASTVPGTTASDALHELTTLAYTQ